jgi:hypothetical protein
MTALRKEDEPEIVWVSLPLDLRTFAWLAALAEECRALPESVGASLLRDVREDDEIVHMAASPGHVAHLN